LLFVSDFELRASGFCQGMISASGVSCYWQNRRRQVEYTIHAASLAQLVMALAGESRPGFSGLIGVDRPAGRPGGPAISAGLNMT
jgi:hypothetical protein